MLGNIEVSIIAVDLDCHGKTPCPDEPAIISP
jgi:hypothetical protein